jgi:hypothetical protein
LERALLKRHRLYLFVGMRIRIVQKPPAESIDGIHLDGFEAGREYVVGSHLGGLFLAEGWAVPVEAEEPRPPVPFSESDPFDTRPLPAASKSNLVRKTYPPTKSADQAGEFKRRRGRKRR